MGCTGSKPCETENKEKANVLIFGAPRSGKSTLRKQLKLALNDGTPPSEDLRYYAVLVQSHVVSAARKMLRVLEQDDDDMTRLLKSHLLDSKEPREASHEVQHCARAGLKANKDAELFLRLWRPIQLLWESPAMQQAKHKQPDLLDGRSTYYLQSIERIASPTFQPNARDVLLSYAKTTQVEMDRYTMDGLECTFYELGGPRRDKTWYLDGFCEEGVDAVLFVASLADKNDESLELFKTVCQHPGLLERRAPILLFLNQKDLFEEKSDQPIAAQPASDAASQHREDEARDFLQRFQQECTERELQVCIGCATDVPPDGKQIARK